MTNLFKRPPKIHAEIVAKKGVLSASEVGAMYGLTRNAVIGIWDRAGAPPLTVEQRYEIQSRSLRAAWERRKVVG